ncbi:MAG: translational GTPase TypA, partial [Chloroflexi bacterium]|nr:translational GTPase TypA [Chloroflexota bacterium]
TWEKLPHDSSAPGNLTPIFEAILEHIPPPQANLDEPFQMLVSSLDWDSFQGKYAIGRIKRGIAKPGLQVAILSRGSEYESARIDKVYASQGLKRLEVTQAEAGDIVAITGIKNVGIGDTVADISAPEPLPTIEVGEPTLKIAISANTSPFAGKEGQFVNSRQILDRINRELETNVSLRLEIADNGEFIVSGRGELHLGVFVETLRREGFELQVGKPQVITKTIEGIAMEPVEELTVDVDPEYAGAVTSEIGRRRGVLLSREINADGNTRMVFEITTRGLLGLRGQLLTLSRGTATSDSIFLRYEKMGAPIPKLRSGVLVASETGTACTYGLNIAQGRGITFVAPQTEVYEGMIVGLNSRQNDIVINVTKEKKQTNIRASVADIAVILTPPTILSLEQSLDFLGDDELLEVTPVSLRIRKRILTFDARAKANKHLFAAGSSTQWPKS